MKKIAFIAAFAVVASAGAVVAQNPGGRGPGGRGGPGGGMMMDRALLKGITLTDAQKQQVEALNKSERDKMEAERTSGAGRSEFEAIRTAREKGDTATANKLMAEQRAKMEARRDEQISALRAILTPDQQPTFDANVAEMKKMAGQRGMGMGGGGRRGRPPVG
jgi:protein CpxP